MARELSFSSPQERPRNHLRSILQQHFSLAIFQRGVCEYRLGIKHVKPLAGIKRHDYW
jgi:hypothetical protein